MIGAVLFAGLVATSEQVGATRARSTKTALLADLIRELAPEEVEPAVALLAGELRQGRVGVGWATMVGLAPATPAEQPTLTIGDVDAALDDLAGTIGPGSTAARAERLGALLARATSAEADHLWRLLTGEVRQGALAGVVADAVAKAAGVPAPLLRRAAMLGGDLSRAACVALAEGEVGLRAVGLTVLRPVQPMLAAGSGGVEEALAAIGGPASVEWKLDGARIQVHRRGDEVRIFTRNLRDVTGRLPGIATLVRSLPAESLVLDGEAIGLLGEGGPAGEEEQGRRPEAFQDTMSRFGRHDGVAGAALVARFFDCLHRDGADLGDRPLVERLAAVGAVAGEWRIPGTVTTDPDVGARVYEDALAAGHEGVVVKAADSLYEAGRRGGTWRKVKPVRTLDLVVLAAEWGHGRRRGWLSNLHLGARDPASGDFVMVGKTFKGLTDALLAWQTEALLARRVDEQRGTVFVRPELVVEIAVDGVQSSTRYPGGVTLRFARVRRYRGDKEPVEADTIDAVRSLLSSGPPVIDVETVLEEHPSSAK
ncbi:ATP-dependent DNA ligase [soil metagenome]